jgi:hypothetical protein
MTPSPEFEDGKAELSSLCSLPELNGVDPIIVIDVPSLPRSPIIP